MSFIRLERLPDRELLFTGLPLCPLAITLSDKSQRKS